MRWSKESINFGETVLSHPRFGGVGGFHEDEGDNGHCIVLIGADWKCDSVSRRECGGWKMKKSND
jgi:hypothetical protein